MEKSMKQSPSNICNICGKHFPIRTVEDVKRNGFRTSDICDTCWEAREQAGRPEKDLTAAGFFKRQLKQTFANYEIETEEQREILQLCKNYAANPQGRVLILIGNAGTGKDHLASAIARTCKGSIFAANEIDLLMKYNDLTFAENEKAAIDFFGNVDMLVIRDVGVKELRPNAKATITNILDRRYNTMKPSIITTNAQPENLKSVFDARIIDRLRETAFRYNGKPYLSFAWESYRKKEQQNIN